MRNVMMALCLLLGAATPALAQVNCGPGTGVALPSTASIGVEVAEYPNLVQVPGYPVYYAQGLPANYFFYDGMFWSFGGESWHSSIWYNGPWATVGPEFVPLFVLRVPVSFYGQPPLFFHGWQANASPLWGEHWGAEWSQQRNGWDTWNHNASYPIAPLPAYQREYSGSRYPVLAQQAALQTKNYSYKPRDPMVQQHYQAAQKAAAVAARKSPALAKAVPGKAPEKAAVAAPEKAPVAMKKAPTEAPKAPAEAQKKTPAEAPKAPAEAQKKAPAEAPKAPAEVQKKAPTEAPKAPADAQHEGAKAEKPVDKSEGKGDEQK